MQKSKRKAKPGLLIPRPAVKGMAVPIPIIEGMTPRQVRLNDNLKRVQVLGPALAKLGVDVTHELDLHAVMGLIELLRMPHDNEIEQCWLAGFVCDLLIEVSAGGATATANDPEDVYKRLENFIGDFHSCLRAAREMVETYEDYPLESVGEPAASVAATA